MMGDFYVLLRISSDDHLEEGHLLYDSSFDVFISFFEPCEVGDMYAEP